MANTITGRVHRISPTENGVTKGGKAFTKRNIVLDCTRFDPYTGERGFENYPSFDFYAEKCIELDKFQQGQVVTIHFDVVGSYYQPSDKYITNVRAYKIEPRQPANNNGLHVAPQIQQPAYQPQPQNVSQDSFVTTQSATPRPAQAPQTYNSNNPLPPQGLGGNDLPF